MMQGKWLIRIRVTAAIVLQGGGRTRSLCQVFSGRTSASLCSLR